MQLTDTHVASSRNTIMNTSITPTADEHLEYAYLWHLEQYRKIYISDQVQRTSRVGAFLVLFIKLFKYKFYIYKTKFLSIIIRRDSIYIDPNKIKIIVN